MISECCTNKCSALSRVLCSTLCSRSPILVPAITNARTLAASSQVINTILHSLLHCRDCAAQGVDVASRLISRVEECIAGVPPPRRPSACATQLLRSSHQPGVAGRRTEDGPSWGAA